MLGAIKHGQTRVVVNTFEFLPGDFTRNADYSLPTERLKRAIAGAAGREHSHFFDATRVAADMVGRAIAANMVMVGFAYQTGATAAFGGGDREGHRAQRRGGRG